jgi:hypothetical protein
VPKRLLPLTYARHRSLRSLRKLARAGKPVVLFTKNDYKGIATKNAFIAFLQPTRVITHTRSALATLRGPRMQWMPFGIDTEMFSPPPAGAPRDFTLGFRASINRHWLNDDSRDRFHEALKRLEASYRVSLTFTSGGQNFLIGQPYVEWIRSCTLLGNTVSAAGTVGPKFLEAMACGTVPLAPPNAYEDFLVRDRHYLAVDPGSDGTYPELENTVERFLTDRALRDGLLDGGRELVRHHAVDAQVARLCREVGV